MSAKGYIVCLSLAGAATAVTCLILGGAGDQPLVDAGTRVVPSVPAKPAATAQNPVPASPVSNRTERPRIPAAEARRPVPEGPTLSTAELTSRAARVEQEANHDLRRLVTLLNLSEEQQDQVFETLARHSRSWSPEMLALPSAGADSAAVSGKKSLPASPPGFYGSNPVPVPSVPSAPSTPDTSTAPATDPMMDEIMALLSPDQQDALVQDELDRAAWWAEILDQITPPEEIPGLDAAVPPPVAGDTSAYEGADVLE